MERAFEAKLKYYWGNSIQGNTVLKFFKGIILEANNVVIETWMAWIFCTLSFF